MLLNGLLQARTTKRALVPGAVACYAAVFGLLIYTLAVHARLDMWRQASAQAEVKVQPVTPAADGAACAELAGMGRKLCNAEAKIETRIEAVRARFQQRVAARKQLRSQPPIEPVKRVPSIISPAPVLPASIPEQPELLNASIAARE
jgi:hypothetical protein